MPKKIEIRDDQYDWLMARGKWKRPVISVLSDVIGIIDLMETDQKKYREWMLREATVVEEEKKKSKKKGGEKDA